MIYIKNFLTKTSAPSLVASHFSQNFCSDDDFKKQTRMQVTNQNAQNIIKKWVQDYDIVLFMKGTPQAPRCGYSGHVVDILKRNGVFEYKHVNILADPVLKEQVKIFSSWPTFPQLFVKGQLIGGSDILTQMHRDGTLKELLEQNNLI